MPACLPGPPDPLLQQQAMLAHDPVDLLPVHSLQGQLIALAPRTTPANRRPVASNGKRNGLARGQLPKQRDKQLWFLSGPTPQQFVWTTEPTTANDPDRRLSDCKSEPLVKN